MFGGSPYGGSPLFSQKLQGTGYKQITTPQFTPEQTNLFKQLFSWVSPDSNLSRLANGDQSQFAQLEAPAMQQFSGLLGGLGSRFSGMGSFGARNSSGFQNTATSAASDFAQQLQSQRMGIQRQALQDLMGISNSLLGQRPYENIYVPEQQKQPGFLKQLLLGLGGAGSQAAGTLGSIYGSRSLGLY
jgi:hypothetical protein